MKKFLTYEKFGLKQITKLKLTFGNGWNALVSREVVLSILSKLKEPVTGTNLDVSELVKALNISDNKINFII